MRKRLLFVLVSIVWLAYAYIYLKAPIAKSTAAHYHLSATQINLLKLSIAIPILIIWQVASYAAVRFKQYTLSVNDSADGKAQDLIANGLIVLVIGVIVTGFVGLFRAYLLYTPYIREFTIFHNRLQIVFPLAAFVIIFIGSQRLVRLVKGERRVADLRLGVMAGFMPLSALYIHWLFQNPNRASVATPNVDVPVYFLSDIWILTTIAVPYIVTWLLGALSAANLLLYSRRVEGVIYRQAYRRLAKGFAGVTILSIALQFFASASGYFARVGLAPLLQAIYLLIIIYVIGYLQIASGARRLTRIEEV